MVFVIIQNYVGGVNIVSYPDLYYGIRDHLICFYSKLCIDPSMSLNAVGRRGF